MFALTHIYCARKINPKADSLFLYGSVFPDIPVLGIVDWDLMKEKTLEFSNFIIGKNILTGFAKGLTVHEDPYGIDRFVHGNEGYAFVKGEELHKELKAYFPKEIIPIAAHSFIEFAVEMRMAEKFPELAKEIVKVRSEGNKYLNQIAGIFSSFFNLDSEKSLKTIKEFNKILVYDVSTKQKSVDFYVGLLKKLRSSDIPRIEVQKLTELSLSVTSDYFSFLEETIAKCKRDFEGKYEILY